jgi:hypothetical protein
LKLDTNLPHQTLSHELIVTICIYFQQSLIVFMRPRFLIDRFSLHFPLYSSLKFSVRSQLRNAFFLFCLSFFLFPTSANAQGWGTVVGHVIDASSQSPLVGATVLVANSNYGTVTNRDGAYNLRLPSGVFTLKVSFVGYESFSISVDMDQNQTKRIDARLRPAQGNAGSVTVTSRPMEAGVQSITPDDIQNIPSPFKDGFRALKALAGVASNNELSNEYSVRGGGYNENLIFVNGFEVYKPFRTRQGEQEGLGLVNPDMTDRMTLYTGGFSARYGGKLSSALDVQYKHPRNQPVNGAAYFSMLDGGANVAMGGKKFGWTLGVRKAKARSFFGSQELKGNYEPDYTDLHSTFSYDWAKGHEVEVLGMWAQHRFQLEPSQKKTYFGTFDELRSVWFNYSGSEDDRYRIGFGGVTFRDQISPKLKVEHRFASFDLDETETYNVRGDATLYLVDPEKTDPNSPVKDIAFGGISQEDVANNEVRVRMLSAESRWMLNQNRHISEAGISAKQLRWDDRLFEESAIRGQNTQGDQVRVVIEHLEDTLPTTTTHQLGAYAQDIWDVLPASGQLIVTSGLRWDYGTFNREHTLSPRVSATYQASAKVSLSGSWGIYYQPPTYRELRGEPSVNESLSDELNHNIKSQRSMQFVMGGTYFVPKKRVFIRAEAYYKKLSNLISYTLENTRTVYAGANDSHGYVYGLDVQWRGELVPNLESWVNYGYMVARERFESPYITQYNAGLRPRAMDQRHTISAFVQDEVPREPSWKVYFQLMYGSGLPYTPPVPGEQINTITLQQAGERHSGRFIEYKRVDLGVTKNIEIAKRGLTSGSKPPTLSLSLECLNIFDIQNTILYTWVAGGDGIWQRIPTHLTPRTFNARIRVSF